jgi:hypothetical protein
MPYAKSSTGVSDSIISGAMPVAASDIRGNASGNGNGNGHIEDEARMQESEDEEQDYIKSTF